MVLVTIGLLVFRSAWANSYIEMITTAPETMKEVLVIGDETVDASSQSEKPVLWYDSRITTAAPVVVSPYPKYVAWQRAQMAGNVRDEWHEGLQNLIYTVEGGLVGWSLYQMFRYH